MTAQIFTYGWADTETSAGGWIMDVWPCPTLAALLSFTQILPEHKGRCRTQTPIQVKHTLKALFPQPLCVCVRLGKHFVPFPLTVCRLSARFHGDASPVDCERDAPSSMPTSAQTHSTPSCTVKVREGRCTSRSGKHHTHKLWGLVWARFGILMTEC